MARLGRLYVAPAGGTTLTDVGVVRFAEPVREESITTDPDTFGRRAELAYDVVVAVQFLQVDDQDLFESLAGPDQPVRIFIAPGSGYGSTVDWYMAISDPDGYTLDDVYPVPSVSLDLGGGQSLITYTFRKRRRTRLFSDGVESEALFIFDAYGIGTSPIRNELVRIPIKGAVGTFSRPTTRPYFDEAGNYRIAQADEPIWSKSPSGLLLPSFWPAATNEVVNNSDHNRAVPFEVAFGNAVSWGGDGVTFTLREVIPSTAVGRHTTWRDYSGSKLVNGAVVCGAYIVKPLVGQTQWVLSCILTDEITSRSLSIQFNLDGTPPTLPAETNQIKPLKAGSIPLRDGYYYVYAAFYIKDKENHTLVSVRNFITNANNETSYAGDGTTPYAIVGADQLFFDIIYPPAPIKTTGSTVTVAQDVLSFPFSESWPAEGATVHGELEVPVAGDNLPPNDGRGKYYINIGNPHNTIDTSWTPFGLIHYAGGSDLRIAGDPPGAPIHPPGAIQMFIKNTVRIWPGGWDSYDEGTLLGTATRSVYPSGPPRRGYEKIEFRSTRYAPAWIRRYVFLRGVVDPKVLLS